ncbi:MAG TPA: zf-HC2 domain-containing protein [Pyrinomonadaceae bacterium]|nr:zf-HC2 domain-containing protein [Pyrinomonadaceae bacterium]
MKCEVCTELLEEYLDGELAPHDREQVDAHLIACIDCSENFATLTAEQELFARYDREIEVPPFLWTRIAAHTNATKRTWLTSLFGKTSLASAIAVLLLAIAMGAIYLLSKPKAPTPTVATTTSTTPSPNPVRQSVQSVVHKRRKKVRPPIVHSPTDQSDVLSTDLTYLDMDEQDTAVHIEQSKILLRSIKNVQISDTDEEIDVTYDKALSRRLLNENVVLRRDAEMKAKFPTKTLLADLEPFLIDIANLPDRARPQDVREIKERVQKTEIVAALLDYQDRGANNR